VDEITNLHSSPG